MFLWKIELGLSDNSQNMFANRLWIEQIQLV